MLTRVELSEEYVVSFFISGFKPEIGLTVKIFGPRTLERVINLAKIQEQTLGLNKSTPAGPQ